MAFDYIRGRINGTLVQVEGTAHRLEKQASDTMADFQDGFALRVRLKRGFANWFLRVLTEVAKYLVGWMLHSIPMFGRTAKPTANFDWLDDSVPPIDLVVDPTFDVDKVLLVGDDWDNFAYKPKTPGENQYRLLSKDGKRTLTYVKKDRYTYVLHSVETAKGANDE